MSTWNGLGSKFYGSKDQNFDGSFVTTEWFVLLYLPVIPLKTVRVSFAGTTNSWRKTTDRYQIIQKLSLDWQQIFSTYFISIGSIAVGYWLSPIIGNWFLKSDWYDVVVGISFLLPPIIAHFSLLEAKPSKT